MFNSYFFAKFALLAVALSISPALQQTQPIFADGTVSVRATKPDALRRQVVSQRIKAQLSRLKTARMTGEMMALSQQNDDLRRSVSASAADRKIAAVAISDLRTKLARAEASAYSRYKGEVDAMTQRLQQYVTDSEVQLTAMKAGLQDVQTGLVQSQRQLRWAMARGIVKRRTDQSVRKVISALRIELSKSQEALRLVTAPSSRPVAQTQTIAATTMEPGSTTSGAPAIPSAAPPLAAAAAPPPPAAAKPAATPDAPALATATDKQLTAEKPKPVKRKPVRQTESSGFSFFP
jgi:predicted transcriptional regulator